MVEYQWQIKPKCDLSSGFLTTVKTYAQRKNVDYLAQILWQRNIRQEEDIKQFLNSDFYQPTSTVAFGQEIKRAINRLLIAKKLGEKVAIWGDFDADGVTATSVLWEGLGAIFSQNQQLSYYIPNRFTESHGLNCQGIDHLAQENVKLIVTCDTGSTNLTEIKYATELGIEIIITDHHTLPDHRPEVVAIINPRYFAENHPLYHLSGVAVAYKLVEAVYQKFTIPAKTLENLLDLVAIGLVADLVQLKGDCRYLAQLGIEKLQEKRRYGLDKLLDLCKKKGDRPMDISFGIGPRINAVSRIKGDASFCVELLTSKDKEKAEELAFLAEEANLHRKEVQHRVLQEARKKLEYIDLSTTGVIVLLDNQWESGVLGLVANSIAQEYARPTILLTTDGNNNKNDDSQIVARGSARSIQEIDLYELVASQKKLLSSFGGHPFAAGLALPLENLPLFTEGINQQLRRKIDLNLLRPIIEVDLVVTVSELCRDLFDQFQLVEPFGMGNTQPKLLIKNCHFTHLKNFNYSNRKGQKIKYIKTTFQLADQSTDRTFLGCWWGHYAYEINKESTYDLVCELDFNIYQKQCEIRIIDLKLSKNNQPLEIINGHFQAQENLKPKQKLTFNYNNLDVNNYQEIWQKFLGIIKYLINHQQIISEERLLTELQISDRSLEYALNLLKYAGISYQKTQDNQNQHIYLFQLTQSEIKQNHEEYHQDLQKLIASLEEEFFQKQYLEFRI